MRRPPCLRRSHSREAALPLVTGRWPEKARTAVSQHRAGSRIAGVDLGDRESVICVIDDASGEVLERATVPTSVEAFEQYFARHAPMLVALETGTHSPWASRAVAGAGHEVVVANARQLPLVYGATHKSDARDPEKLARLARVDVRLLAPVTHRSREQQRDLSVIRSRHALVRARTLLINAARGMVKAFGSRLPKCSADTFHKAAWPFVPSELGISLAPVFASITNLTGQIRALEDEIERLARDAYPASRLLTQVPGVGNLTALAYQLTLGDPRRFSKSRMVGPYLGLAPGRKQSGDRESPTSITKAGDRHLRSLLVQSANHIVRRDAPDSDLKRHGRKLAKTGSKIAKRIAKVAVARKLSVLLHALWVTGEVYESLRSTNARRRRQPPISA
jgi:transposase